MLQSFPNLRLCKFYTKTRLLCKLLIHDVRRLKRKDLRGESPSVNCNRFILSEKGRWYSYLLLNNQIWLRRLLQRRESVYTRTLL